MNLASLDDHTLIRLIARKQQDALSELYDRYSRLAFSLALQVVGDSPTAEEITLDVFTRIWQKAATYRADQAQVSTWLTSITRNRSIDVLRRRRARPEQDSVSWAELSPTSHPQTESLEKQAAGLLDRDKVRAAVAQLPAEQQKVLSLAYFGGYTQREIAQELDLPLGTVKTRIRLAMNKLRRLLENHFAE